MATPQDHISMALFCDFENVALGVRDAKYDRFDIKRVLERLLLKGSIVVKKSYCDWERYKGFKATMHEANFELIEIPHVRQSGKNSADIRLVVDALDLCYTKSHVNTFVIISGDSDFSPLVSKLRENAKHVIGVGVKQSTSDLLIANCDEFIFYDDLVRESQRVAAKRESRESPQQPQARRTPEEERSRRDEIDARRNKAVEMAADTFDAMVTERGDSGKIWASVLKEAIKRRNPGFSESYYGFKTFGNLLEEAQARGLLEFGRDEKSGAYVFRGNGTASTGPVRAESPAPQDHGHARRDSERHAPVAAQAAEVDAPRLSEGHVDRSESRRRGGRGGRKPAGPSSAPTSAQASAVPAVGGPVDAPVVAPAAPRAAALPQAAEPWYEPIAREEPTDDDWAPEPVPEAPASPQPAPAARPAKAPRNNRSRQPSAKSAKAAAPVTAPTSAPAAAPTTAPATASQDAGKAPRQAATKRPARKRAPKADQG